MNKKECFVEMFKEIIKYCGDELSNKGILTKDGMDYFEMLAAGGDASGKKFTTNGKMILDYLKEHYEDFNNMFKAKELGEAMGISSKTVSGAMRKLVTDGYIDKIGTGPSVYSITEKGIQIDTSES